MYLKGRELELGVARNSEPTKLMTMFLEFKGILALRENKS